MKHVKHLIREIWSDDENAIGISLAHVQAAQCTPESSIGLQI